MVPPLEPPGVLVCDLHTHTRFFHRPPETLARYDWIGARAAAWAARRRGLDGLAVTNHDYYRPDTLVDRSFSLPGIEISTTGGHVLVVGPDPPARTDPGELTPEEAVELAHDRGCAAIIAHPFRNSRLVDSDAPFDAVEVNGKHPEYRSRVEALASERGLPIVGGSDAHFPFEVGRAATRLDVETLDASSIVAAIREGRVEPAIREGRIEQAMGPLYTRIHRRNGHIGPDRE